MKIIHVLFLCTAVSIAALSALVLMAAGIIYSRDFYYTHDFEHYPLGGDCWQTGPYGDVLEMKPYILSSNNTWPLYAGYAEYPDYNPTNAKLLTAPGMGYEAPYRSSWYAIWGNSNNYYGAHVTMKVHVSADHPIPERIED